MSDAIPAGLASGRQKKPFAPNHPWDRNLFLALVLLMWLGILVGFGWDVIVHFRAQRPAYPLIVHVHALAFVAWLVLLTTQVLLVRARRVDVHRKVGSIGIWLAAIMPILGIATQWVSERLKHGTPVSDAPFMSISITLMLGFAVLVAAGFRMRSQPPAHKRLMLLSTLYLSSAGFARWWFFALGNVFGPGFWSFFVALYVGADLLIAGLGAYDLVTRGRLHPAYVAGCLWILANEFTGAWLYFDPRWQQIAARLGGY